MTMSVTLPATPSAARLERHTVTGSRILVVDDDPAFGDSTARVLRVAGFEVYLALDHRLALEDLESTRRSIC
jgi:CheY-like chemotaxis protein